jgi:hypothetical protein
VAARRARTPVEARVAGPYPRNWVERARSRRMEVMSWRAWWRSLMGDDVTDSLYDAK